MWGRGSPPGIGRIYYDPERGSLEANYIDHTCARHTPETSIGGGRSLVVSVTTFDSAEGVVAELASIRESYELVDTPVRLGDESVSGVYQEKDAFLFRTGRAAVAVKLIGGSGQVTGDGYQTLLPAAAAISERLPR